MTSVLIYTTPSCSYCKLTKEFFQKHNFTYTEKDVAADSAAADEMFQRSGQMGVPVIFITTDGKEEMVVGFDEDRFKELLKV